MDIAVKKQYPQHKVVVPSLLVSMLVLEGEHVGSLSVTCPSYSSEGFTISSRFSNSLYAPNRKFLKNKIKKLISISLHTLRERTKTTNRTIVHVFSLQIKLYLSDRQRSTSDPLSLLSGSSYGCIRQDLAFLLVLRLIRKHTHPTQLPKSVAHKWY